MWAFVWPSWESLETVLMIIGGVSVSLIVGFFLYFLCKVYLTIRRAARISDPCTHTYENQKREE